MIGFFDVREPVYLARDVDFIRQITSKDFEHFEDDIGFYESISDSLFGKSLFLLSEKEWRDMRSTLSPTISGTKFQHEFDLIVDCAENTVKHLIEESKQGKPVRWEMKELFARYATDVIASTAFGLKVNSFRDRENEFFTIGSGSLNVRTMKIALRLFLSRTLPKLMRAVNIEFFPAHFREFFKSVVLKTTEEQEKTQLIRPDEMINIMMKARNDKIKCQSDKIYDKEMCLAAFDASYISIGKVKQPWTDDEILTQCFLFLAAGYETASTVMAFMAYELALNQDVQQKLYKKIRNVNASLNGARLSYDTLSKLKYLDQVITESLRQWPPVMFATRKCTKDYEYELNGDKIIIERGRLIWIPVYCLHHDDRIYKNPRKFDPDRFSDENKHKINPCAYIPFGIGPRNNIGITTKLTFVILLNHFCSCVFLFFSFQAHDLL